MTLTNKVPENEVNHLFSRVAANYDLMNNVISLGVQNIWRQEFLKQVRAKPQAECLDLCCGTGTSTFALSKKFRLVTGLDFNQEMLARAKEKAKKHHLQAKVKLVQGDAMHLPFADNSFACVSICFGLRNVPDAAQTIAEAYRVLQPGGQFLILEMSQPTKPFIRLAWQKYFCLFPYLANLVHSKVADYQYLSRTSQEFLTAVQLKKLLEQQGFAQTAIKRLTFGAGALHSGFKPCD